MSIYNRNSPAADYPSDVDRIFTKSDESHGKSRTVTQPGVTSGTTLRTGERPTVSCRVYQATNQVQDVFSSLHLAVEPSPVGFNRNGYTPVTPLLIECDDCSGAGQITHDHPNDPWAKAWTCSMCDGTGQVIAGCECCREDAVEIFDGSYLCEQHAAEARADALLESAP